MKVRVLGCSGGIGGYHLRTTSMLVDHDLLVDAGTGVAHLSRDELAGIDHVFLTHSHLDHIAPLPLLIDSVSDLREQALTVHATAATLEIIRKHIFNWAIRWSSFYILNCKCSFDTFCNLAEDCVIWWKRVSWVCSYDEELTSVSIWTRVSHCESSKCILFIPS